MIIFCRNGCKRLPIQPLWGCELDPLCSDGSESLALGEVRFEGTASEPVTVRAKDGQTIDSTFVHKISGSFVNFDGPFAGDADGCVLKTDELDLADARIKGGCGLTSLCVATSITRAERMTFDGGQYGFHVLPTMVKSIAGSNTYTGVTANYMELFGGSADLEGANTCTNQGVPWLIVDNGLQVMTGATLTLEAGVELQFQGLGALEGVIALGDVVANGTADKPVKFSGDVYSFAGNGGSLTVTNGLFKGPEVLPMDGTNLGGLTLTNVTFDPGMSIRQACGKTTLTNTMVTIEPGC